MVSDIMRAVIKSERQERKVRHEEREEERRDRQLQFEKERKLRAEERAKERAFCVQEAEARFLCDQQAAEQRCRREEAKDNRMMRTITMAPVACNADHFTRNKSVGLAFGFGQDGKPQANLQNSVPLGVNVDDPNNVVPLVSNKENFSKRPCFGLGHPPVRK